MYGNLGLRENVVVNKHIMEKYNRINCNFYDQLEIFATFNKELNISYLDEDATVINDTIKIKTLETKNKEEFLITMLGRRIRLDKIVTISEI